MGLVGADIERMRDLIAQLSGPLQGGLNSVLDEMNDQVQASDTYWVAEDGDKFRASFAAFVRGTKTQLDSTLSDAAKITGQNLHAIGTATGNATGQQATGSSGQNGSAREPLSYYWTKNFIPDLGNLVPDPWTHLLAGESRSLTVGVPRFLLYRFDGDVVKINIASGEVPDWASTTATGIGVTNILLSAVSQGITTYEEGQEQHWSTTKLWAETLGQAFVIGGTSGAASFTAGWYSTAIVNKVGTWAGSQVSPKFADYVANQAAAKAAAARQATEAAEQTQAQGAEQTAPEAAEQAAPEAASATEGTAAETAVQTAAVSAEEQAVAEAQQAVVAAERAAAQAVAEAQAAAAQDVAQATAAGAQAAAENAADVAQAAEDAAQTAAQSGTEVDAAVARGLAESAEEAAATAAEAEQAAAVAAQAAQEADAAAAAARAAVQAGTETVTEAAAGTGAEAVTGTAAETAAGTSAEAATGTAAEAGTGAATDVAADVTTDVAADAAAETAGEALATIGGDALIGAALGSEVPILGNVVGLVVGFAVGTIITFAAGRLGSAIGHTVWHYGGDIIHDLFL